MAKEKGKEAAEEISNPPISVPQESDATVVASQDSQMVDGDRTQEIKLENLPPSDLIDPPLGVPRRLGHLVLLEKIGQGGWAAVYRAKNPGLEVERAVKVLLPEKAREKKLRDRFHHEAILSAGLRSHRNLVQIHNIGEENGFYYIEMDLVRGPTLTQVVEQIKEKEREAAHAEKRAERPARLPIEVVVAILAEVAEALHVAHTSEVVYHGKIYQGVVHRDLKPDNIKITPEGVCKLLDMGIARPIEPTGYTQPLEILGSIPYMSPEQWEGIPENIDHRTDLFSLGIVLYEMCTGERPFQGKSYTTISDAARKGRYTAPEKFNPKVLPDVERIIRRALQPRTDKRYQSAREIMDDLRALLREWKIAGPQELIGNFVRNPQLPLIKVAKPPDRGWLYKIVAIAAVVAVIAVGSVSLYSHYYAHPQVVAVTVSANYGPIEVYWNDEKVATSVNPEDLNNFIIGNVKWGSQNKVRIVLLKTGQEKEISFRVEKPNPVIRVNF